MKKGWIWTRSDRSGIWVFSTILRKEWGNDWDGIISLTREEISINKIKKFNNLMGLIHRENIPSMVIAPW